MAVATAAEARVAEARAAEPRAVEARAAEARAAEARAAEEMVVVTTDAAPAQASVVELVDAMIWRRTSRRG